MKITKREAKKLYFKANGLRPVQKRSLEMGGSIVLAGRQYFGSYIRLRDDGSAFFPLSPTNLPIVRG
jgi:hypothetical protein